MNTSLVPIFIDKLDSIKSKIIKLMKIPKKDRNRKFLKKLLLEAKSLKRIIKSYQPQFTQCPFCKNRINLGIIFVSKQDNKSLDEPDNPEK